MVADTMSLYSILSADIDWLLKSGDFTLKLTFTLSGNKAPRHLRGRNAEIGVNASILERMGNIGPCAERL